MILFFYNLALLAGLILGLPFWLWRIATTEKYREGMWERLGHVPLRLRSDGRPVIWLHAVSVGEVLAVSRLVSELGIEFPNHRLLISTTTRTGQALARERFGSNRVFYCPLDLPWAVRAYLNAIQPELLILAETEFWPNLLNGCSKRGIPVAVVNARISDRSWPRYLMLRSLWKPFLSRLSLVLAQTQLDAERLEAIGCSPERVSVLGNLKFDVRVAQDASIARILRSLAATQRFVIAGSTLEGEESALLDAWPQLLSVDPNLLLVLAPRHPERFDTVANLLRSKGVIWMRRSEWTDPPDTHDGLGAGNIVLLDTIGELASVYSLASIAFIGGSLVPAGGHNPLEPAQFGVPIVMGPNYENFHAIVDNLRRHDAIQIADKDALTSVLIKLLDDRPATETMGAHAREVFERQAGATARSSEAIRTLLEKRA